MIKAARKEHKLTQEQLGELIGIRNHIHIHPPHQPKLRFILWR
ncbi:helix-turn-helix domain-containing protein [Cyclobacterium plantarum]